MSIPISRHTGKAVAGRRRESAYGASPVVSIGLPVYNGMPYLDQAVRSYLEQTFPDFELIISDNASTDGTEELCRSYARQDGRIRYYRWPENRGATANFNRVFRLARGEYFKWAAHDDWCGEEYLEACLEVLRTDPEVVLCQTRARWVTEEGADLRVFGYPRGLDSPEPVTRFRQILWRTKYPFIFFGLMPTRVLAGTRLLGRDAGSDRVLLAELSLRGRIREVEAPLFYNRRSLSTRVGRNRMWWDPNNRTRLGLRTWRLVYHLVDVVLESDLSPAQKGDLTAEVLARYLIRDCPRMTRDVFLAGAQIASRHRV